MAIDKRLYWIGAAILVIFLFGMMTQNKYEVFSVVTFTHPQQCADWMQTEKAAGNINPNITMGQSFCWLEEGVEKRWISQMGISPTGCELTYTLGCDYTNCSSYCESLFHVQCVGSWQSSGTYPKCSCAWICGEEHPDTGFNINNLLPYLPWVVGILGIVALVFWFTRRR